MKTALLTATRPNPKFVAALTILAACVGVFAPSGISADPNPMDPANWTHDMVASFVHGPVCASNFGRPQCWVPYPGVRYLVYTAKGKYLYTRVSNKAGKAFFHFPDGHYSLQIRSPQGQNTIITRSFDIASPFPMQTKTATLSLSVCTTHRSYCILNGIG